MGLHRQPFVRDLLECVQEDGEAVCVSALRAMATEQQEVRFIPLFHRERERCALGGILRHGSGFLHSALLLHHGT